MFDVPTFKLGILPRNITGLVGIFTSPLIHGSFSHLISNTAPLIFMGLGIFYFYPKVAYKVFTIIYLGTGILVWIFAREVYHIGASGIIYGFVSFLFFSGIFRKDNRSIALALVVVFLYGGLIWGVLPVEKGVSWESHLFGAIVGIIPAFIFRKIDFDHCGGIGFVGCGHVHNFCRTQSCRYIARPAWAQQGRAFWNVSTPGRWIKIIF